MLGFEKTKNLNHKIKKLYLIINYTPFLRSYCNIGGKVTPFLNGLKILK